MRNVDKSSVWIGTGEQIYEVATECAASAFFFVLFFLRGAKTRRGAERFTIVEQRQIAYVQRQRAGRRLLLDDDRDRTAFDTVAERDAAATSQPRVRESLQHSGFIIPPGRSIAKVIGRFANS